MNLEMTVEAVQAPKLVGQAIVTNPLENSRWDSLLASHPEASFFHSAAWARVLHETYGHKPFYFCRFDGDRLQSLLPVMEVASPLTGRRGVSLPFSDFCLPLKAGARDGALYETAVEYGRTRGWRYLECRSGDLDWHAASKSVGFYGHAIELNHSPEELFKNLESSVARGIRKAEAAKLQIDFGEGLTEIRTFYTLHCQTRQRHGLPPQPFRFFENIARHVLEPGFGFVTIARLDKRPVAASVFFHGGCRAIYKFGASDFAFQQLRANNLVMWEGMKRCASKGMASLHLGRTSVANEGLRRFKLGFGAVEEPIEFRKYDLAKSKFVTETDRADGWANHIFRHLPSPVLRLAGQILYPHLS
jgi:hypothetical protein